MNPLLQRIQDATSPLHHFYLVDNGRSFNLAEKVKNLLEKRGSGIVSFQTFSQFGIEDAQQIRGMLSLKATEQRYLVFAVDSFTNGALQSLLKLLEEPGDNTHLFFIVPNIFVLPETIRSRAYLITTAHAENEDFAREAVIFLEASFDERFTLIDTLLKKADSSGQERELVRKFLDGLESILSTPDNKKKHRESLHQILEYKKYLLLPGAHVRMILETLAICV